MTVKALLEERPQRVKAPARRPGPVHQDERRTRAAHLAGNRDAVRRDHVAKHGGEGTGDGRYLQRSEAQSPRPARRARRAAPAKRPAYSTLGGTVSGSA